MATIRVISALPTEDTFDQIVKGGIHFRTMTGGAP